MSIGLPRVRRAGLGSGRFAVSRRPDGQHLPHAQPRFFHEIGKGVSLLASVPTAAGEGREVMCISTPLWRMQIASISSVRTHYTPPQSILKGKFQEEKVKETAPSVCFRGGKVKCCLGMKKRTRSQRFGLVEVLIKALDGESRPPDRRRYSGSRPAFFRRCSAGSLPPAAGRWPPCPAPPSGGRSRFSSAAKTSSAVPVSTSAQRSAYHFCSARPLK